MSRVVTKETERLLRCNGVTPTGPLDEIFLDALNTASDLTTSLLLFGQQEDYRPMAVSIFVWTGRYFYIFFQPAYNALARLIYCSTAP